MISLDTLQEALQTCHDNRPCCECPLDGTECAVERDEAIRHYLDDYRRMLNEEIADGRPDKIKRKAAEEANTEHNKQPDKLPIRWPVAESTNGYIFCVNPDHIAYIKYRPEDKPNQTLIMQDAGYPIAVKGDPFGLADK